jgi:hypothetical protein
VVSRSLLLIVIVTLTLRPVISLVAHLARNFPRSSTIRIPSTIRIRSTPLYLQSQKIAAYWHTLRLLLSGARVSVHVIDCPHLSRNIRIEHRKVKRSIPILVSRPPQTRKLRESKYRILIILTTSTRLVSPTQRLIHPVAHLPLSQHQGAKLRESKHSISKLSSRSRIALS